MNAKTPKEYAQEAYTAAQLPAGVIERIEGFAVMGLPFSSGNYLAYRCFPHSSFGPGYQSVWLRRPNGEWSIYADADPELSCARFFGDAVHQTVRTPITGKWNDPYSLSVSVPGVIDWQVTLADSPVTSVLSAVARIMPRMLWHNQGVLGAMGKMMGVVLQAGKMRLEGRVPNGQLFRARPLRVWPVSSSHAEIDGSEAGIPQPLAVQEHLRDAWLPQRGLFVANMDLGFTVEDSFAKVA